MSARFLFPQLLGVAFDALPTTVRALHTREGVQRYRGSVEVERGNGLLSRLCAWATRLPPAWQGPITVEIAAIEACEHWTRIVACHAMRSRLWAGDGLLCERLGLVTFGFRLGMENKSIVWRVARVRALGIPLPAAWFGGVTACESERGGRYNFDVAARLPLAGLLVHYRGSLDVE
ncbi:MAG TPA: DUF4166 domain-containing protein [Lysobacter sp.]|jgi:hypothetical protein|nr:DUF4166 domain-containing protein [Lysobacter sp.]